MSGHCHGLWIKQKKRILWEISPLEWFIESTYIMKFNLNWIGFSPDQNHTSNPCILFFVRRRQEILFAHVGQMSQIFLRCCTMYSAFHIHVACTNMHVIHEPILHISHESTWVFPLPPCTLVLGGCWFSVLQRASWPVHCRHLYLEWQSYCRYNSINWHQSILRSFGEVSLYCKLKCTWFCKGHNLELMLWMMW